MSSAFDVAQQLADAVLYEGYMLYPYRASDTKNRVRWQFGVLVPPAYAERDGSERTSFRAECLVDGETARLTLRLRFLHVQRRAVEAFNHGQFVPVETLDIDDTTYLPWDEAVERQVDATVCLTNLGDGCGQELPFRVPGGRDVEELSAADGQMAGRFVRERSPLAGTINVSAEPLAGPYGVVRLRVEARNESAWQPAAAGDRADALRGSLVAAHLLAAAADGAFISLLDPPEWARAYAEGCENSGVFPVLACDAGRRDLILASPIILYDHPQVAPESPTDLFDATEIDELLSLRTLTLTDAEKREARGTDPRAGALIDHVETMPPDMLDRLHGAVRYLRTTTQQQPDEVPTYGTPETPWWDPGADASVSPESDSVVIAGVPVHCGSEVLLRPGTQRADAQDMFLTGRTATVAAVLSDVDGRVHLAVTPKGDEAAELQQAHGRFLYFAPDEVTPLESG